MISADRTRELVSGFDGKKILVVGDLMLDRYVHGSVDRISPEAPVPVVRVKGEDNMPGGSANVARNIRSLGADAVVAGVTGADEAADVLVGVLEQERISTDGISRMPDVRTTVKTRILADRQQVARVDWEDDCDFSDAALDDLYAKVAKLAKGVDGIVIEDYGKGVVRQALVDSVLDSAGAVPVGFDPKENHDLRIPKLTVATPNYKEACWAAGVGVAPLVGDLATNDALGSISETLFAKWHPELLIVTLGQLGMYVASRGNEPEIIAAKAQEVFDVSGAGDTVIAVVLLSLAAGASHVEAAMLANHAAGVVVGKIGTATCSTDELLESLD